VNVLATKTETVKYIRTTDNGCQESISKAITIHYVAPPIVQPLFQDMVHNPIPQLTATGSNDKWYSKLPAKTNIGSGSPFQDPTIGESDVITKDYWVTQTVLGCESQTAQTKLEIDACPVPAPTVDKNGFKRCVYDNSPDITVSSGITWPLPESAKHSYSWYNSQNGTIQTFTGITFNPNVNGQIGVQTYYVAEYDSLYTCFGPRQKVTFTIVPVAQPAVLPVDAICQNDANKTFTINTPIATNTFDWYGTADTLSGKIAYGISFTPKETIVGIHNYWVSQTDGNNCHSEALQISMEIKPRPGIPTLSDDESCDKIEPIKTLTASGDPQSYFEWYKGDSINHIATNPTLLPAISSTTIYYVRQNLNNCTGWFAPVTYTIKLQPDAPIVQSKAICSYNDIPSFTVTATGTVNWYNQSQVIIGNDNPFTPSSKTTSDFYITQTIKGCESPQTQTHFEVHPIVPSPIVTDKTRNCENIGSVGVTVTSGTKLKWYTTNDTVSTPIRSGGNIYNFINKPFGVYHIYVTQTDVYNCQSQPYDALAYVDSVPQKPTINEQSVALCEYDVIPTLSCTNKNAIEWYTNELVDLGNGPTFTPTKSQLKVGETRNFMVKVTSPAPGSCVSLASDTVKLTIKPTPAIPIFITRDVCTNDSSLILFKHKSLFSITDVPSTNLWTTDSILLISKNRNQTTGVRKYVVYQTINGCNSKTDTARITVLTRPNPIILGPDSLCERSFAVPYSVAVKNEHSTYNWNVTGARTQYKSSDSQIDFSRNIDYIEQGIDTITVAENNGYCIGTGSLIVKIAPPPTPDYLWDIDGGLSKVSFINTSTQNDITDGTYKEEIDFKLFRWDFGNEVLTHDSIQSAASFNKNDQLLVKYNYGYHLATLTAVNSFGCSDKITKKFFIDLPNGLYIPNSFIPTSPSSELNKFLPKGFNLETYKISIFDSWGNLIWYSDKLINGSPEEGWDGRYQGEILKLDCYIWKIEATFKDGTSFGERNGKKQSNFGNILLLR
jgi:hypothetical protein